MTSARYRVRAATAAGAAVLALAAAVAGPAAAVPAPGAAGTSPPGSAPGDGRRHVVPVAPLVAPSPTSTAASPDAPDPAPPVAGTGPDGRPVGGAALLDRGLVVPPGSPPLPAGVTAAGWVLADLDRGTVLAARDAHGRYPPASVLKTLTALVLLPRLPDDAPVPVSPGAAGTEGSAVGLVPGGSYDAGVLFDAMLLMSGNDATTALAEAAGGPAAVVAAMGAQVRALGGYDTVVQTVTGLDGWTQLTSAYDLTLVLREALAQPRFVAHDRTARSVLPAQTAGGVPVGTIELDNQSADFLQGYPGALVAKTGFTDAARHTFSAAAERGGRRLGVVMLRAERVPTDQWQQAATLFDWGFDLPAGTAPVGTLPGAGPAVTAAGPTTAGGGPAGTAAVRSTGAPAPAPSPGRAVATRPPGAATDLADRRRAGGGLPGAVVCGLLAAVLVAAGSAGEVLARRRARSRRPRA